MLQSSISSRRDAAGFIVMSHSEEQLAALILAATPGRPASLVGDARPIGQSDRLRELGAGLAGRRAGALRRRPGPALLDPGSTTCARIAPLRGRSARICRPCRERRKFLQSLIPATEGPPATPRGLDAALSPSPIAASSVASAGTAGTGGGRPRLGRPPFIVLVPGLEATAAITLASISISAAPTPTTVPVAVP